MHRMDILLEDMLPEAVAFKVSILVPKPFRRTDAWGWGCVGMSLINVSGMVEWRGYNLEDVRTN